MKTIEEIKTNKKLSSKLYRDKNKDKISQYEKIRRQRPEVKEKLRVNVLRYYYKHKLKQLERMKRWREENKEWFKKYRQDNRDKLSSYQIEYQNRNPNNIMIHRLRSRLQTVMRIYSKTGKILSSRKYGIDYKSIIEHLKPFPDDLSKYHIDHIKPLSSFNLNNREEIKKAFAPENHQWLLAFDNLSKHSKVI